MAQPFSTTFPAEVTTAMVQPPEYVTAADGTGLAYYAHLSQQPRAILIFYHGGGAWSMPLYQYMAQCLAQDHGIGVYLVDLRGHGNSQGPRGDAPSAEVVWDDVTAMVNHVQDLHPETPLFLGGHSSGAALVLNYQRYHDHPAVAGYLFLAPYLGVRAGTIYEHEDLSKRFVHKVRFLHLLTYVATGGWLCAHSPVIFFNYSAEEREKDPFILEAYTNTMTKATSPYDAPALFSKLSKPLVMLIGSDDEQFIPDKVVAFEHYLTSCRDQAVCQILPGATHLSIVYEAPAAVAAALDRLLAPTS